MLVVMLLMVVHRSGYDDPFRGRVHLGDGGGDGVGVVVGVAVVGGRGIGVVDGWCWCCWLC